MSSFIAAATMACAPELPEPAWRRESRALALATRQSALPPPPVTPPITNMHPDVCARACASRLHARMARGRSKRDGETSHQRTSSLGSRPGAQANEVGVTPGSSTFASGCGAEEAPTWWPTCIACEPDAEPDDICNDPASEDDEEAPCLPPKRGHLPLEAEIASGELKARLVQRVRMTQHEQGNSVRSERSEHSAGCLPSCCAPPGLLARIMRKAEVARKRIGDRLSPQKPKKTRADGGDAHEPVSSAARAVVPS